MDLAVISTNRRFGMLYRSAFAGLFGYWRCLDEHADVIGIDSPFLCHPDIGFYHPRFSSTLSDPLSL